MSVLLVLVALSATSLLLSCKSSTPKAADSSCLDRSDVQIRILRNGRLNVEFSRDGASLKNEYVNGTALLDWSAWDAGHFCIDFAAAVDFGEYDVTSAYMVRLFCISNQSREKILGWLDELLVDLITLSDNLGSQVTVSTVGIPPNEMLSKLDIDATKNKSIADSAVHEHGIWVEADHIRLELAVVITAWGTGDRRSYSGSVRIGDFSNAHYYTPSWARDRN